MGRPYARPCFASYFQGFTLIVSEVVGFCISRGAAYNEANFITLRERMTMWNDFKTFIMRGNVIDMAVGVIIGAAFSGIVTSLVGDILMPPLGLLMKGV